MQFIQSVNNFLWGYPILFLLMGTHLYFTLRLKCIQKKVFHGIHLSISPEKKNTSGTSGGLSSFTALMTTLAATLGTGNIIGMSTAVALGGPGAVFWCWITGVLGMATSYAECYLSHRFRTVRKDGTQTGGSMYIFSNILNKPGLALIYAVGIVTASLLLGCANQSNAIAVTTEAAFNIPPEISGIICTILVGIALIGGCRIIGRICTFLVPFMGIFYIICCLILLYLTKNNVQIALKLIFSSAFSQDSLTGGMLGGGLVTALRYGIARGLFTNEAGIGSAGIAAATAHTDNSSRQALISMTGVFWDTVVMCGITGIILITCYLDAPLSFATASAGDLTLLAFSTLPYGEQILSVSLILFAISTILGWFFLGEQGFSFLFRNASPQAYEKHLNHYKCAYLILLFSGSVLSLDVIWEMTDFINLFLLLPNLYLLFRLRKQVHG